jgi:hypothetical protein
MQTSTMSFERFDFAQFQQTMMDFYRSQVVPGASPEELVMAIDASKHVDYLSGGADLTGLLASGHQLFFIFHTANTGTDPFQCVDGSIIAISQCSEEDLPNEVSGYGYLLSRNGSELTIAAAFADEWHINATLQCAAFDGPMATFIKRFVKPRRFEPTSWTLEDVRLYKDESFENMTEEDWDSIVNDLEDERPEQEEAMLDKIRELYEELHPDADDDEDEEGDEEES